MCCAALFLTNSRLKSRVGNAGLSRELPARRRPPRGLVGPPRERAILESDEAAFNGEPVAMRSPP